MIFLKTTITIGVIMAFSSSSVFYSHQGATISLKEKQNVADTSGIRKGYFSKDGIPVPECHASTILHLSNGEIIAAWFGGKKEGNDNVGIWMVKGKPGNWTEPFEIAKKRNDTNWNTVLFQSPEGKIFLFFKVGKKIPSWET